MEVVDADDNGVDGWSVNVEVFGELQISIRCRPY